MLSNSKMLCWKWIIIRVGVILAISVAGSDAATSNFSTSTSTYTSTGTSTSAPNATITSCGETLSVLDLLAPSVLTLPPDEILSIFSSEIIKLNELASNLVLVMASPTNLGSAALSSYLSSLYSTVEADVTALFGPAGNAILSFQNIVTDPCLFVTCFNQFLDQSVTFAAESPSGTFFYTAEPPCCLQCTIYGQGVQLEYWPTPAPEPPVSTLIDEATNYTFVSPSVYAVFTNLRASNLCGAVGGTYNLETLAFGPTDLSTSSFILNPNFLTGQWTAINYADFGPQCICTTNCAYDSILGVYLTNLCTPQLSVPAKVSALDPAWGTCGPNLGGVFDPPIALPLASGLTTPKSTPAQLTPGGGSYLPPGTSAVPVNSPTPSVPSPTPQPKTSNQPTSQIDYPSPDPAQSSTLPVILLPSQIGGTTSQLPLPPTVAMAPPTLTINGQTVTANAQSDYVIGTQTLIPGGPPITISGTPISLAPGVTEIVIGGTSTPLGSATGPETGTKTGTTAVFTGEAGREVEIVIARAVLVGVALSALIVWL